MGTHTGLLEQGFADALQQAAELDRRQAAAPERRHICPSLGASNVELLQEELEFYRGNQALIDAAIGSVADHLKTVEGAARFAALRASLEESGPTDVSEGLASDLFNGTILPGVRSTLGSSSTGDKVKAIGIGAGAGYAFIRGKFKGGDHVFDLYHGQHTTKRHWKCKSCEIGLATYGGPELSFWLDQPLEGKIGGLLVDFFLGTIGLRYNSIRALPGDGTKGTFAGVSLQFGPGLGAGFGGYLGNQTAFLRPEVTMINTATGVNSIAVETTGNTVAVTLTNTPGETTKLWPGATIYIKMPSFFTSDDMGNMNIVLSGWTFSCDQTTNTLMLSSTNGGSWTGDLSFDITNVGSSKTPTSSSAPEIGYVLVDVDISVGRDVPIAMTTTFDLVWANSNACLKWTAVLNSDDFTLQTGYALSGTVSADAEAGDTVKILTQAVSTADGSVWDLGYIYNYNTLVAATPQISAVWYKDGAQQRGNNIFQSAPISESGQVQEYYAGLSSTGSSITICAVFDPTESCSDTSQYTCS